MISRILGRAGAAPWIEIAGATIKPISRAKAWRHDGVSVSVANFMVMMGIHIRLARPAQSKKEWATFAVRLWFRDWSATLPHLLTFQR